MRAAAGVWRVWGGPRTLAPAGYAVLAAGALLGLSAAATVEITFTIQPSYALLALAVAIALPHVLRGWLRLPRSARLAAAGLLGAYLLATAVGDLRSLPSQARGGGLRSLIYLADLVFGLAIVGLLSALWSARFVRHIVVALVAGATGEAAYTIYQWFALQYGLPLSDVNSAPNSDGFTTGHRHQGEGLLGWERPRGTFKEPLFLGLYLAAMLPLAAWAWDAAAGRARLLAAAAAAMIAVALLLTASILSWGLASLITLAALLMLGLREGRPRLAGVTGAAVAAIVLAAPVMFADPSAFAALTGRSGEDLRLTSQNRTRAWQSAERVWARRPVTGYGPGQSSVRLAYRADAISAGRTTAPIVLGSAQGVWAASLIDAGLLGLAGWVFLLATLMAAGAAAAWRRGDPLLFALLPAAALGIAGSQLAGDRPDVRMWFLLGLLAAATPAAHALGKQAGQHDQHAAQRAR